MFFTCHTSRDKSQSSANKNLLILCEEQEVNLAKSAAILMFIYSLPTEKRASLRDAVIYFHSCFINNYQNYYRSLGALETDFKGTVAKLAKDYVLFEKSKIHLLKVMEKFCVASSEVVNATEVKLQPKV